MEDIQYLATQFVRAFVGEHGWDDEEVRNKNFAQTPKNLAELKTLFFWESRIIEIVSVLLNAGMAGREILLAIHEAAAVRQWELKEKDKKKAVEA